MECEGEFDLHKFFPTSNSRRLRKSYIQDRVAKVIFPLLEKTLRHADLCWTSLIMASVAVKSIDHVVLTVKDIPTTVEFYTIRLGMKNEVFESKGTER